MPSIYWGRYGDQYKVFALMANSNTGQWPLGHVLALPDGREFCFGINDAVAEVAGDLYSSAAPITNYTNMSAQTGAAVGSTTITATDGGTAAAQDLFMEGFAHINAGIAAGLGYSYKIKRAFAKGDAHASFGGSSTDLVNLAEGETVQVALVTTTSKVTYTHNRFRNTIINATSRTASVAGVAPYPAAASIPLWYQVEGYAPVLTDGTIVLAEIVVPSTGTAGAVMASAAAETDLPAVGNVVHVNATTTISLIDLKLGH